MLLLVPSTKVLGCSRIVRFANEERAMGMSASKNSESEPGDLKLLAEGFHSSITSPFVAVVRDADTYSALVKLESTLPALDAQFFKSNLVIGAFLGERNTGGYSVEVCPEARGYSIAEKKPGKGMMVPQMITAPFKVVSISMAGISPLQLTLDGAWNLVARHYGVIKGEFTVSGGFAGRVETFRVAGEVTAMRANHLVTVGFMLRKADERNKAVLTDFSTGVVESAGTVRIHRLSAGLLVPPPDGGLEAEARFTNDDRKLSINLKTLPSMIADGYSGKGSIEAVLAVPRRNKKA